MIQPDNYEYEFQSNWNWYDKMIPDKRVFVYCNDKSIPMCYKGIKWLAEPEGKLCAYGGQVTIYNPADSRVMLSVPSESVSWID